MQNLLSRDAADVSKNKYQSINYDWLRWSTTKMLVTSNYSSF